MFGVKGVAVQADGTLTAYLWPIGVDGRDLAAACAVAGCAVTPGELRGGDADQELEKRMDLLKTLVTSACCTAPLMLEMHPKLQFLAGTALQFGPGRYFYKSAWRGLRNRTFGMDFLVSLSSTLIYLYSAYVTFTPRRSYKLYFASDGVLLSLILFGKYMEQVAAGEANSAIRKLMHLQPRTAMVQRGDTFVELPVDQIAEHDLVRIRPGERVPVDGTVVSGQCAVDESMLTGESMPVDKAPGDKVIGGSLNRSGSAIVSAEALGKASVLEQIIQIVCQAQCEKAPVQRFADKVARWFVPGVIGAAALTFFVWYRRIAPRNLERALLTCCDVLSVACPCALGLATPTGLMVGSGRAAEHGILFKSGAELENAYKADCVVFDKTGTLTNGAPALTDVCPCSGVQPEDCAAFVRAHSDHGGPYVFKGSYRKANRSRLDSFMGIGDEKALKILQKVHDTFGVPTVTDIHAAEEATMAAEYVDILQIPAFLCRQTDLLVAAAKTGKTINIKKGQFLSPLAMRFAADKVVEAGNRNVMLTERGTTFGYQDLVIDYRGIPEMQTFGFPVILDVTHSLQQPNQTSGVTGGMPQLIETVAKAGVAVGVDGLFIETHENPAVAKSDGANMLKLDLLEDLLTKLVRIREAVR